MTDETILYPDTPFDLHESLILLGRRGSEAHGTFVPSSNPDSIDDRDLMGVCIPPEPWTLGLREWDHAESIKGCWDVVLYDFRKFVRLLCKQNPNVLGMLYLEPEDYLSVSPAGSMLLDARELFRSKGLAYESFVGYAHGQMHKMTHQKCEGYMGKKRKELVERFGFDAKNGAHLVRLLHMGIEYLRTGRLQVRRTEDREMLIAIKRGEWTLEDVKKHADDQFAAMKDALTHSVLPESVDFDDVNRLVIRIMKHCLRGGR